MPLWNFAYGYEYEKLETELISKLKPKVFIDVGAHIGYYTMLVHKLGAEKIIAIEPDPRVFRILNRAIEANKLENIITINIAAYNKSNVTLELHLSTKSGFSSISSSHLPKTCGGTASVKTITLDEVVRTLNLDKIDLVKIDVEGAEAYVLLGAQKVINQFRPLLLVEVLGANRENVFEFFGTKKYDRVGPFSHGQNFLFIPEEHYMKLSNIVTQKYTLNS
jgi:FkbM family methyltransferase